MKRIYFGALLVMTCPLLGFVPALAQTSYEDLSGRFMFDLPPGWQVKPTESADALKLEEAGSIRAGVVFQAGVKDRAALFTSGVEAVRSAVPDAVPEGDVVDQQVNGLPARWGVFRGTVTKGSLKIKLYYFVSAAVMKEGGLYLTGATAEATRAQMQPLYEKLYQSIREVDAPLSGVSDTRPVPVGELPAATAAEPPKKLEPTPFNHWLVNLTLPGGWVVKPEEPNPPKAQIAKFESESTGASITLMSFEGRGLNPKKVYDINKKAMKSTMPSLVEVQDQSEEQTATGETALVGVLRGSLTAQGKEVPVHFVVASAKHKKSTLSFLGTVVSMTPNPGISEVISIVKSAH